jgi:uncharacterized membrane protein YfcA
MGLVAAAFAILAVAAAVQAASGFGFALAAVPLLAVITDARTAVVGASLAGLVLGIRVSVGERGHIRWPAAGALIVTSALGMPFGVLVLRSLNERALGLLIAATVLVCVVLVWRGSWLPSGPVPLVIAGLAAGVMGTATGANGPPLVAALQAMNYEPRQFRATLAVVFAVTGVLGVAAFTVAGQVTRPALLVAAAGVPGVLIGWELGNAAFTRLGAARFRNVVLALLVTSSVVTVIRVVTR